MFNIHKSGSASDTFSAIYQLICQLLETPNSVVSHFGIGYGYSTWSKFFFSEINRYNISYRSIP